MRRITVEVPERMLAKAQQAAGAGITQTIRIGCARTETYPELAATAHIRAKVLGKGRKARLGDALIAQSCIDRGIPLLTRDRDFRAFAEAANLSLVISAN